MSKILTRQRRALERVPKLEQKATQILFTGRGPCDLLSLIPRMPIEMKEAVNAAVNDAKDKLKCRAIDIPWKIASSRRGQISIHVYDPKPIEVPQ